MNQAALTERGAASFGEAGLGGADARRRAESRGLPQPAEEQPHSARTNHPLSTNHQLCKEGRGQERD